MVQGTVSSAGLPPPWQEVHAEGLTYYWNTQTNETTYDRPVAGAAPSKPGVDYSYLYPCPCCRPSTSPFGWPVHPH